MYVIGSKKYLASAGIRTRDPWGTVEVTAVTKNSRLRMQATISPKVVIFIGDHLNTSL